jgi:hypothetical protein
MEVREDRAAMSNGGFRGGFAASSRGRLCLPGFNSLHETL